MKSNKIWVALLVLLISAGWVQGQALSQFSWDGSTDERIADVGPNASSSGSAAAAQATGNGTPQGLAPGIVTGCFGFCTNPQNINMVLPNPGNMFDVPEIEYSIDYRNAFGETEVWFFSREPTASGGPEFRLGLEFNKVTARFAVDNGAGGHNIITLNAFTYWSGTDQHPADDTWRNYQFVYYQGTGVAELRIDGNLAASYNGPDNRAMVWPASPISISPNGDNQKNDRTMFDNALIQIPTPLPVVYSYFEGERVGLNTELNWETLSESNSSYFRVMRAAPGGEFQEIGIAQAAGNSNDPRQYTFVDVNPQTGSNFYRLDQVDGNGQSQLSAVIEVLFEVKESGLLGIYPNPVNESSLLKVKFQSAESERLTIQVFDLQGQMVWDQQSQTDSGINLYEVPVDRLKRGVYVVRVVGGQKAWTRKFIRQ